VVQHDGDPWQTNATSSQRKYARKPQQQCAESQQNAASQRIVWLMEELGIEYDLSLHKRVENRAPPELSESHFMGKAPQLVLADGRVLIESNTVAKYLIETYDTKNKFKGDSGKNDALRDDMLSDFIQSSMSTNTVVGVLFLALAAKSPFFLRPLCNVMWKGMRAGYWDADVALQLRYLSSQLEGQDYLMGSSPGRSDFLLSWTYDNLHQRKLANMDDYPSLKAWRARCEQRPAWKRSLEKGNGYDVSGFD
jgi:glutathione S-transferase